MLDQHLSFTKQLLNSARCAHNHDIDMYQKLSIYWLRINEQSQLNALISRVSNSHIDLLQLASYVTLLRITAYTHY